MIETRKAPLLWKYLVPSLCAAVASLVVPISFFVARDDAFAGVLVFAGLCFAGCVLLAIAGIQELGKRGLWLLIPVFVALPWPASYVVIVAVCATNWSACP